MKPRLYLCTITLPLCQFSDLSSIMEMQMFFKLREPILNSDSTKVCIWSCKGLAQNPWRAPLSELRAELFFPLFLLSWLKVQATRLKNFLQTSPTHSQCGFKRIIYNSNFSMRKNVFLFLSSIVSRVILEKTGMVLNCFQLRTTASHDIFSSHWLITYIFNAL